MTSWVGAWVALVAATGVTLALTPYFALLEGFGRVREVARLRAWQDVAAYTVAAWLLGRGYGILAYPALQAIRAVISGAWLALRGREIWRDLAAADAGSTPRALWRELWPMQWRIALSWLSGFFIFQTFTPIAYLLSGAVAAGRLGMSLALTGAVTGLAAGWLSAQAPTFGRLIALREHARLEALFGRTLRTAVGGAAAAALLLTGFAALVRDRVPAWGERILDPSLLGMLAAVAVANVAITAMATYLRAFKREPFLVSSLVGAALTPAVLLGGGRAGGVTGMVFGYAVLTIVLGLPWAVVIYSAERRRGQGAAPVVATAC